MFAGIGLVILMAMVFGGFASVSLASGRSQSRRLVAKSPAKTSARR